MNDFELFYRKPIETMKIFNVPEESNPFQFTNSNKPLTIEDIRNFSVEQKYYDIYSRVLLDMKKITKVYVS